MSDRGLRESLLAAPLPDEHEAQRRSWGVVHSAFATREPLPRRRPRVRLLVALAVLAAAVAAALSPPGRAVGDWVRDRVAGQEPAAPALVRLPSAGTLLVVSERGPWLVRADGSKRLLGDYEDASFSPRALHVVATAGRRVVALTPGGDVRWTVTRPAPVADARWAPSGFRVAYRESGALRVVVGNGEGDRLLAEGVAAVAPAWRPDETLNVLAYADTRGRVRVVDVDSGDELARTPRAAGVRALFWTADGLLVAVTETELRLHNRGGRLLAGASVELPEGHRLLDAVPAGEGRVVYADHDVAANETALVEASCFARGPCRTIGPRRLFAGAGRLEGLAFSPDGRWLLAGWPDADQFLFLRLPQVQRIVAVDDVRREFDPGGTGRGAFPRAAGWCCAQ